jgi:hypothetical protein
MAAAVLDVQHALEVRFRALPRSNESFAITVTVAGNSLAYVSFVCRGTSLFLPPSSSKSVCSDLHSPDPEGGVEVKH